MVRCYRKLGVRRLMQLMLPVALNSSQTFSSFVESEASRGLVVNELQSAIKDDAFTFHFIFGKEGTGKSHLLSACCHHAQLTGKTSVLLPMQSLINTHTDMLAGLENIDVVCIDDIQVVSASNSKSSKNSEQSESNKDWELALFVLFNRLQQNNATLVFSATLPSNELPIAMPDLASRLQWCTQFQLYGLTESEKVSALISHANLMGFDLAEEVAQFMLNRLPRNMHFLMQALHQISKHSILEQRKVTLPFVKDVLEI